MLIRIAVASTPLTSTMDDAVPAALSAIKEAGIRGASVVCLPEACLPGHRMQARAVPDYSEDVLEEALAEIGAAAAHYRIVTIVGTERNVEAEVEGGASRALVEVVYDADGKRLGEQQKTQVDPSEEKVYAPGSRRRVFTAGGVTFGLAICHEVFRYPEITRALVLAGAQIVFAPHFVTTKDGSLPSRWLDPAGPYNEKALLCRAMENTVYVAAANIAMPNQGSATCIIAPDGTLVASVPYGQPGVVTADVDLDRATRLIARRWSPDRSVPEVER